MKLKTKARVPAGSVWLSILLALGAVAVHAQSYSISWYKIAGGGGASTNSTYSVSGTIGQPDAGATMTGGNYALTGGFWAFYALQTAGAPALFITHSGNTVTVFWEDSSGWALQQNGNLSMPKGWTASSGVTKTAGTNYLNLTNAPGNLFFRLQNP